MPKGRLEKISEVFGRMFAHGMRENAEAVVDLSQATSSTEALTAFCHFLQSNDTSLVNKQNVLEVLSLAHQFMLLPDSQKHDAPDELTSHCFQLLKELATPGLDLASAVNVVTFAHAHGFDQLFSSYIDFMLSTGLCNELKGNSSIEESELVKFKEAFFKFKEEFFNELISSGNLAIENVEQGVEVKISGALNEKKLERLLSILKEDPVISIDLDLSNSNITQITEERFGYLNSIKCNNCFQLTTVISPNAKVVHIKSDDSTRAYATLSIRELDAPEALDVEIVGRSLLSRCNIPQAVSFKCHYSGAETLFLPKALEVDIKNSFSIHNLDAPEALKVRVSDSMYFTTLKCPQAREVYCRDCILQELDVPEAMSVDLNGCTSLGSLNAPTAEDLNLQGCENLKELNCKPEAIVRHTTDEAGRRIGRFAQHFVPNPEPPEIDPPFRMNSQYGGMIE